MVPSLVVVFTDDPLQSSVEPWRLNLVMSNPYAKPAVKNSPSFQ
jgi:hypothetical protein